MKDTITQSNTPCQCKSSPQVTAQLAIPKIGDSGWFPLIDKYPVVVYVVVRDGKEISARPCNFGGDQHGIFQRTARLEVSGILKGDKTKIEARLKQKLAQTKRSDTAGKAGIPAYVVIVEFGSPEARFVKAMETKS